MPPRRSAGLARPSRSPTAGPSRSSRGSNAKANANARRSGGGGGGGGGGQDRFSSQRERDRLRRAAEEDEEDEEDDDDEDGDGDGDHADAQLNDEDEEDDAALPEMYRVPKPARMNVPESALTCAKSLGKQETERRVNALVRLALFHELKRQPLRREDITKRVLDKQSSRAFPYIFNRAQSILRSTFCYELAPIRARGVEHEQLAAQMRQQQRQGKTSATQSTQAQTSKKGKQREQREQAANDSADEGGGAGSSSKSTAKAWILRSLLPLAMTTAMAEPNAKIAAAFQHNEGDGDGDDDNDNERATSAADSDGMMLDWKRSDNSLGAMGLTWLILGFILLNGRSLPNDQFRNLLYRLRIDKSRDLPESLRPNSLADGGKKAAVDTIEHPSTLKSFMKQLVRQGYLEEGELNQPMQVNGNGSGGGGKGKRRKSRNIDNNNANGDAAGENADDEDDDIEWKWGPRAEVEIGEEAVAQFIIDVYVAADPARGQQENEDEGDGDDAAATSSAGAGTTQQQRRRFASTAAAAAATPYSQTQTQNLSPAQRKRRAAESEAVRKEIERAVGSQLVG